MHVYGYRSWSCSVLCKEPFWFYWSALKRRGLLWEAVTPLWLCTWMGPPFPRLPLPWGEPMPCIKPKWFPGSHSSLLCSNFSLSEFVWQTSNSVWHTACRVSWREKNMNLIWRVNLHVSVLKMDFCTVLEAGWIVLEAQRNRNSKHAARVQHLRYCPVQRRTWRLQLSTLGWSCWNSPL